GSKKGQPHDRARAVFLGPGDNRPRSVRIQLDVSARVDAERRPPTARDSNRLVVWKVGSIADQLDCPLQRFLHPDAVEYLSGGPLGALFDQGPAAELNRIQVQGARQLVHMLLECPADLRRGRGANGAGRLGVRVVQVRLDLDVLDLIRAAGVHGGHLTEEAALAAVGALVQDQPAAAGDERSVAPRTCLELDHHSLATVVGCNELLLAGEDDLDRAACRLGECGDMSLEMEVALGAEATAEKRDDDTDLRL